MTLILACWLGSTAIVAADRRIHIGPLGGPLVAAEGDKLFVKGSCVVASYGRNPVGIQVPDAIRELQGTFGEPAQLAADLFRLFSVHADAGALGLLIAGLCPTGVEFWEVAPGMRLDRLRVPGGIISSRGVPLALAGSSPLESIESLAESVWSVYHQVSQQTDAVGPPFEMARIGGECARADVVQVRRG